MNEFLNSFEVLPQSEFPYVDSDVILNHLFDVINRQVFNSNLDGIQLEWCDKSSSHAIVTYEVRTMSTRQTYIRCSKTLFRNRSRQQFVEAILYELIHLYVQKRGAETSGETSPDLMAYLIYAGLYYFNATYKTNLVLNHNHKRGQYYSYDEVTNILKSVHNERKPMNGKMVNFTMGPQVSVFSKKITGDMNAVKCNAENGCGGFCYCPAALALRRMYFGANIYFIFTVDRPLKCFLCENNFIEGQLNSHFNKNCKAFGRLKQSIDDDRMFLL